MRIRRASIGLLVLNFFSPVAGRAQNPVPFSTVELGLSVLADPGPRAALQRYWEPELGVEATATAPFYAGAIQLGLQHMHHEAKAGAVPGFRARLLFVGWGGERAVTGRIALGGGLRLGIYMMRFDGDTIPDFRRNESELGAALRSTAAYALGAGWRARASAGYQIVFTDKRVEQLLLSAGISRALPMPSWLRDFFD